MITTPTTEITLPIIPPMIDKSSLETTKSGERKHGTHSSSFSII